MLFRVAVVSLLASFVAVNAAPELERRQIDSVFNSLTSVAASVITGDGGSIFSQATAAGGSLGDQATSVAAGAIQTLTSFGGAAATVVTSVGGQAITLAESGGGVVTSIFGSEYTVATGAAGSAASNVVHSNAANIGTPFGFTTGHAIVPSQSSAALSLEH